MQPKKSRVDSTRGRSAGKARETPGGGGKALRLTLLALLGAGAITAAVLFVARPRPHSGLPARFASGVAAGYNILLITLDTTRADHLGCYGDKAAQTPVLDGLAGKGILFADAVAPAPITLPSHASILTGLYPPDHGGRVNGENVIVVGGHGEGLGEHGEATHTRLIYESVMHVPLIVSCPKLFKGAYRVEDAVVTNADIVPTVLDLLGLPAAPDLDGVSMVHCREDRNRAVYLESVAPYVEEGWSPLFGLRRHADKYILAPRPEYYELATDPRESKNLFTEVGGAALEARQQLVTDLGGGSRIGPRSRGSPRRSSRWTRRHARSSPRSATSGRRPRRPRRRPSPIPRT